MEEEDEEGAGAAEEQEEVDSKDEDGTPSWVLGGFESAEAEQEHFERWQQEMRR